MEIIIIGTEPPCPRCRETYERVKAVAKEIGSQPSIRKIVYLSEEAQRFGKVGTAHEVADWAGFEIDWDEIRKLASGEWTPKLDHLLMPLKEMAEREGWVMTPVVVIDGEVVHFGNVPEMAAVRSWLVAGAQGKGLRINALDI